MKDIQQLLINNKIEIKTRGSQISRGWIGVCCPYCGDDNFHLGYNKELNVFSCWRCGTKPLIKTLKLLTGLSKNELEQELKLVYNIEQEEKKNIVKNSECFLPKSSQLLQAEHKEYLCKRGFNPNELEKIWGLRGVGDDGTKWANRIIIPIYFSGRLVSFTSRDITDKNKIKALTCPQDKEVIHCKNIVHGFDLVQGNSVIVTEGPFDAMKFGPGAVSTLGIKFTEHQVSLLGAFRNIFIVFDSIINDNGFEKEKIAQEQAQKLADSLAITSNVWVIDEFESDPSDMTNNQIKRIKKEITKIIKQQEGKEDV